MLGRGRAGRQLRGVTQERLQRGVTFGSRCCVLLGQHRAVAAELLAARLGSFKPGDGALRNHPALCWRPHKTLRSTGKMLKVTIIPSLQAALDAMPKSGEALAFLTNDYGRPFASAAAFGNKFADWCTAAGLQPVLCWDGRIRNFRAHGLRKAALRALAHASCTAVEMMHVSGHSSVKQLLEYLEEVEQELMADNAMDKLMAAGTKRATGSD